MPILIGAGMIAAAILLSTLITAVGTRFAGVENPSEENLWLIDRLSGSVYKCQAPERGKAACEAEVATGKSASVPSGEQAQRRVSASEPTGLAGAAEFKFALHRSTQKYRLQERIRRPARIPIASTALVSFLGRSDENFDHRSRVFRSGPYARFRKDEGGGLLGRGHGQDQCGDADKAVHPGHDGHEQGDGNGQYGNEQGQHAGGLRALHEGPEDELSQVTPAN